MNWVGGDKACEMNATLLTQLNYFRNKHEF